MPSHAPAAYSALSSVIFTSWKAILPSGAASSSYWRIVSPEISGRVVEVLAEEGQTVTTGDILFRLDGALLEAQRSQAETSLAAAQSGLDVAVSGQSVAQAALDTAQVQYQLEYNTALAQAQAARAATWNQRNT